MNIYLDIDGVLINKNKIANGASEFLEYVIRKYDVFWLSTHCNGSIESVDLYLKKYLPIETHSLIEKVKPTKWDVLKTDAIDFSVEFLWLDDYLMESEKRILLEKNVLKNQILVNLKDNPNQLLEIMNNI